jgi:hypothetical protein
MDPNTPLTIATARYKTRPEAVKAFKTCWGAHHQGLFDHMALAVLTRGEDGQLQVERHDTTTKHLAWGGLAIGAALTVVCPPAGIAALAAGGAAGAGIGAWIGHFWNTIPKDASTSAATCWTTASRDHRGHGQPEADRHRPVAGAPGEAQGDPDQGGDLDEVSKKAIEQAEREAAVAGASA